MRTKTSIFTALCLTLLFAHNSRAFPESGQTTFLEQLSVSTEEEGKILQLCFSILFFYNMSEDRERQKGMLDILDEHATMTGDVYRWTQNPKTKKWKKLESGVNSYINPREWVLTNPNYRWSLIYHAGEKASDASDIEFYTLNSGDTPQGDDTSFLRIHFPVSILKDTPALLERIRHWCGLIQPDHGYAGFSFAHSHGYERGEAVSYEYIMAQRFPGLDVYDNVHHSLKLGHHIKGADWLVILSDAFLNRIGGLPQIRERMGSLPVLDYPGGAILQAGPLPQLGDTEQDLPMTEYRQVAAIIEPLRHKNYKGGAEMLAPGPKFTGSSYMQWLARFSPEPE